MSPALVFIAAMLNAPIAFSQQNLPTTTVQIHITGDDARDLVNILTESGASPRSDATSLSIRRLLCINLAVDDGHTVTECAYRPQVAETPVAGSEFKISSRHISEVGYHACMLYPDVMPLVCDIRVDERDLSVVSDLAQPLFAILSKYAPMIPPLAPYALYGVDHLSCNAPQGTLEHECKMEAKVVRVPPHHGVANYHQ